MTAQKNLGDRQRCLLLFIDPFSFSYPLLSFLLPLSSLEQMGGWPCGLRQSARARPGVCSGGGARGLGPVSAAAAESAARPGGGKEGSSRWASPEHAGWARRRRPRHLGSAGSASGGGRDTKGARAPAPTSTPRSRVPRTSQRALQSHEDLAEPAVPPGASTRGAAAQQVR